MRFRYCGDLDTPDWVLSKVLLISKLSNDHLKLICDEVVKDILEGQLNLTLISEKLNEYKYSKNDCKAIIAAITFIFKSSVKYNCEHDILLKEIQQLGMPKESSQLLSKIYKNSLKKLRENLESKILRVNKLKDIEWNLITKTNNNYVETNLPLVELKLDIEQDDKLEKKSVILTLDKLIVISEELKTIKKNIQKINNDL